MRRFCNALLGLALLSTLGLPVRADDAFLKSGTLWVGVADDFANQKAEFHYQLRTDDGEILRLRFTDRGSRRRCPPGRTGSSGGTARDFDAGEPANIANGAPVTGTSTVNFRAGQTRANNVTMALGASGNVAVDSLPSGTAHVILDVVGWFE